MLELFGLVRLRRHVRWRQLEHPRQRRGGGRRDGKCPRRLELRWHRDRFGIGVSDASDADARESGSVEVVIFDSTGPESGVAIVFSDASGAVVTTAITNANGRVTQDVATGGQVTALFDTPNGPNLVTVTGVKPGDVLNLLDGPIAPSGANAQVTIAPFSEGDASVNDYSLSSAGCSTDTSGAAGTFVYGLGSGCSNASGQVPVLVQALDSLNDGLAWQSGEGSLLASDAGVASVDLTSTGWTTTFGTQRVTLVNAPDSITPGVGFTEITAVDAVSNVAFGLSTFTGQYPDAGVQTFEFTAAHPGFAAFDQIEADNTVSQANGATVLAIADRVAATTLASPSASDTIDLNDALPAITSATLDATHPTQPTIAWVSAAPLTSAAATVVQPAVERSHRRRWRCQDRHVGRSSSPRRKCQSYRRRSQMRPGSARARRRRGAPRFRWSTQ